MREKNRKKERKKQGHKKGTGRKTKALSQRLAEVCDRHPEADMDAKFKIKTKKRKGNQKKHTPLE